MGTEAHIIVSDGPSDLLERAERRLVSLEARWTRFDERSELCRLNRRRWASLSDETYDVVERAVAAWGYTDGSFDPTTLSALRFAGYDRTFEDVLAEDAGAVGDPWPSPGCARIELDRPVVRLPEGVALDLGGIGKGRAADLVATELVELGATGALVNIGGDLRAAGRPTGGAWVVQAVDGGAYVLSEGAVATSSTTRRRWRRAGERMHHLIDPATGAPSKSEVTWATVIAAEAWWAEVLAKAALLAGLRDGAAMLVRAGVAGVLRGPGGYTEVGMQDFAA